MLLVLVGLSWCWVRHQEDLGLAAVFEVETERVEAKLAERMRGYTELLRAASGLFHASNVVSPEEFGRFVQSLELELIYPGIQGVGFAQRIPGEELQAHLASMRASGFPDYVVTPEGARPVYASVIYLEPFAGRNMRAFGYDMYTEPVRRAALDEARDTGSVALSAPLHLLQETKSAPEVGLLSFQPVYRHGALLQTVEQRRAALVGWTFSPYRMNDLVEGILRDDLRDVRLELFDGDSTAPAALLFDSHVGHPAPAAGDVVVTRRTGIEGHPWTMRLTAQPGFARAVGRPMPWWALVAMLAIAALVWGLAATGLSTQDRARVLAAQLSTSLGESEARYRSIVDNVNEVVFQTDREGRWSFLNKAWTTLTGGPVGAALGRRLVDSLSAEHDALVSPGLAALLAGRQESFRASVRLRCEQGNFKWVQLELRPSTTETGVTGLLGTLVDVTELREAEAAANRAREAAEQANQSKGEFLAIMSHEIRTPMNGVMGMAQVLLGTSLSNDQRSLTTTIVHSAESLLVVLNDILDYSKVEAGRMEVERNGVSVRALTDDVVQLLRAQAAAKQLVLESRVDPEVPEWIVGDGMRLRQVLLNLVGNALKFTSVGRVTIEVKVEAGRWMVSVTDTGIGISSEVLSRLFTPFTQGEQSTARRFGGTGLGLSISKRLVLLMGGELTVESSVGQGSRFVVSLPLEVGMPGSRVSPVPRSRVSGNASALIVDDNATNRLVLERLLQRLGIATTSAADGGEALELLRQGAFDLVLMDIQMPMMDGDEATRRIRAGEAGAARVGVPIVAMTADATLKTRERCLVAGMNDYLTKPVQLDALHGCVDRWLPEP